MLKSTSAHAAGFIASVASCIFCTSIVAQTVLVDEDWQTPLTNNNIRVDQNMVFPGWTFANEVYVNREDNHSELPSDSTVAFPNQAIRMNGQGGPWAETNLNHNWNASDTYYLMVEASPVQWSGTRMRYIRPEIREADDTILWKAPQDETTAIPLWAEVSATLDDWHSEQRFWFEIDASTFSGVSGALESSPIKLRLALGGERGPFVNNVKMYLGPLPVDNTPPSPDPVTWEITPTVSNFIDISMKANSARDDLTYDVQYLFTNTVLGTSSGWQEERIWSETNLAYDTTYTYMVKARDKSSNQNETSWSAPANATTDPADLTPPSPDPLTWSVTPTNGDYGYVTMTVNAATDASGGVEYLFTNTVRGTSSGWQTSTNWNEGQLNPVSTYSYMAKARDISPAQNESTTWSSEESETTVSVPNGTLLITRFQCPTFPVGTILYNNDFAGWTMFSDPKSSRGNNNGFPSDDSLSEANQGVRFDNTDDYIQYDIPHNWSASDVYTLTLNAVGQYWPYPDLVQRYVRPKLLQQDGTVLWDPGENMSGADKTAIVTNDVNYETSSWQAEPDLNFSYTIDARTFTTGTPGEPIRLRVGSSGSRGLFIDNIHLHLRPPAGTVLLLR